MESSNSITFEKRNQVKKDLFPPIRYLKGVGPKRAMLLSRLGVETVEDLLWMVPKRYEDRSHLSTLRDLRSGEVQTTVASLLRVVERKSQKGIPIVEAVFGDATGTLRAIWFNQPYLRNLFSASLGKSLILHGKVEPFHGLQMNQPEYEIVEAGEENASSLHVGRIVPVYPLTAELSQRWLRTIVHEAIVRYGASLSDPLPSEIHRRYHLLSLGGAVASLHFPSSLEEARAARQKLIFNEFFLFGLSVSFRRTKTRASSKQRMMRGSLYPVESYARLFPFPFTGAQRRVMEEIRRDLESPIPMNRLLQGDVGSGKTLVVLDAMVLAVKNGFQAAIMVPTEILAEQHAATFKSLLSSLDIRIARLTGGIEPAEGRRLIREIEKGRFDLVIGTHALIEEKVRFQSLGLIVIDEQHKFGVIQRSLLRKKGENPDVLVMTATPIPRTLALTLYGDLDISILNEMPPGRAKIETRWVEEKDREEVYHFLRSQLGAGRQGYVVYPLIEESEKSDLLAATKMSRELQKIFPEFRVGLLHGRMKSDAKEEIMRAFRRGALSLLVSTIVVEVGIDVPNATVMVIEHGERFGLSQLHQLRGRIARSGHPSFCYVLAAPKTIDARKRLTVFSRTTDGFRIAEEDLLLRGPGEFFGKRQHGLPELKIGNIVRDIGLLELTKKEAAHLLEEDPHLMKPSHFLLRQKFLSTFKEASEFVAVG